MCRRLARLLFLSFLGVLVAVAGLAAIVILLDHSIPVLRLDSGVAGIPLPRGARPTSDGAAEVEGGPGRQHTRSFELPSDATIPQVAKWYRERDVATWARGFVDYCGEFEGFRPHQRDVSFIWRANRDGRVLVLDIYRNFDDLSYGTSRYGRVNVTVATATTEFLASTLPVECGGSMRTGEGV